MHFIPQELQFIRYQGERGKQENQTCHLLPLAAAVASSPVRLGASDMDVRVDLRSILQFFQNLEILQ